MYSSLIRFHQHLRARCLDLCQGYHFGPLVKFTKAIKTPFGLRMLARVARVANNFSMGWGSILVHQDTRQRDTVTLNISYVCI